MMEDRGRGFPHAPPLATQASLTTNKKKLEMKKRNRLKKRGILVTTRVKMTNGHKLGRSSHALTRLPFNKEQNEFFILFSGSITPNQNNCKYRIIYKDTNDKFNMKKTNFKNILSFR